MVNAEEVPGPVDLAPVGVDDGGAGSVPHELADPQSHLVDAVDPDVPAAPVGRRGQPTADELGRPDHMGGHAGRLGDVELRGQRLPHHRVGVVPPQDVVEHPLGAGHVEEEAEQPVRAGGGSGAQ